MRRVALHPLALITLLSIASPASAKSYPRGAARDATAAAKPSGGAGASDSTAAPHAAPASQTSKSAASAAGPAGASAAAGAAGPAGAGGANPAALPTALSPTIAATRPGSAMPKVEDVPMYFRTRAERSGYHVTPDYDETMRYLHMLEGASQWIKVTSYGKSGQGRDLPLVIVSKDRAFTPEAARATGKPIVLIQNGIHSGEIEGKDASLALIRDLAALRTRAELLDHAVLLVLPIFSLDAHERRSARNRINQNGPDEMGWRFTPIGLNLNRDYVKVESPEMRAMISQVFTRWWPHLLVDNHTTDGADFRHDLGWGSNFGPDAPAPVGRWVTGAFEARVVPRFAGMGHLPSPYINFRRGDPLGGIDLNDAPPRFSTGYAAIQCRPGILVETHMLKPYETRVRATYDLMVALLEELNAHPGELTAAVAESESLVAARARSPRAEDRAVTLTTRVTEKSVPFAFKGIERRMEPSDIAGAPVLRYTGAPWDTIIPIYRDMVPALVVNSPPGYLVPQEWAIARDKLEIHAVRFRRFARAWSDTVEVPRLVEWKESPTTFEGHHNLSVSKVVLERRLRAYRPGDLWVPCDQRAALVAMHLLEAQAPDGLVYWNAFDTVLEPKEYAEDYVMEPIARRMLSARPDLAKEFQARLAADTAFAHSPAARLDFFYRRSDWADPEANLVPVARALRAPPEAVLAP
jgi:murein tripeptide amidase MpaA